jgi:hypothetical protein
MSTWRLLARIGLSGVRDSLTYGATLTTPGLGLFGSGGYRQSVNLTDQTGAAGNIFGVSYQEGLTAHYHSPFGAAAGASYGWGTWRVHSAAEWWNKVNSYAALEGEPFTIQTPSGDSTATATVADELESVFNFGFGLEKHFGNDLAGFASYHTDRSGHPENGGSGASVTAWDLNHVTIGVTFNAFRSTFAIGQSVAFGSRPIQGFALRPDRVPEPDVQTHALILTGTIGWNLAF